MGEQKQTNSFLFSSEHHLSCHNYESYYSMVWEGYKAGRTVEDMANDFRIQPKDVKSIIKQQQERLHACYGVGKGHV